MVKVRNAVRRSSHRYRGVLTLINTRLSLRSQSVIDSLFERDIASIDDILVDFRLILYGECGCYRVVDGMVTAKEQCGRCTPR